MIVYWTPDAQNDLDDAYTYISTDNAAAADQVEERVLDVVAGLAEWPQSGRTGVVEGTRELVITRTPYIAVYELVGEQVNVLRLIHGRRQWPPTP